MGYRTLQKIQLSWQLPGIGGSGAALPAEREPELCEKCHPDLVLGVLIFSDILSPSQAI